MNARPPECLGISPLRIAQRWALNVDSVTEMAEAAQERFGHGPIAQEVGPLVIRQSLRRMHRAVMSLLRRKYGYHGQGLASQRSLNDDFLRGVSVELLFVPF